MNHSKVLRPYLRVANVQDGWVDLSDVKEVEVPLALARRCELQPGDVLMTEGGDPDKLGRGTVWHGSIPDCLHQNHIFAVRPTAALLPSYLAFLTQSTYARGYFEATASKTTGIASTNVSKIASFRIPLPGIADQIEITDFLDAETARIDTLIAKKRRMLVLLEERTTSTIAHVLGAKVRFSPDGVPVSLGCHPMVRLGAVATVQSGLTLDEGRSLDGTAVSLPYLRVANVQDGWIDLSEVKKVKVSPKLAARCKLKLGDVLMTEGGDPDKLGRGTVWQGEVPGCIHQNHIFAVRPAAALLSGFLALLTRTPYARMYFEVTASKTTGIASTSTAKIGSFRVPLPSLDEQQRIVDEVARRISVLIDARDRSERQIVLLQERRQALITAAVTGQLNVARQMAG